MRPEIEQAVRLIQRKDPKSVEEALQLLQNTVFSFSMKVCGQRQDAEDTMQEVLLKAVPSLPKFDSPKALVVWLYKVAKSRCLMSRRKSKFAPKEDLSLENLMPGRKELANLAGNADRSPETLLLQRESANHLRNAIRKLPPEYRIILVLHDTEDLSDDEIAEITGLRPGTIRVRLHRARLFVRKELAKEIPSHSRRTATAAEKNLPAPSRDHRCKKIFAELSNYLDDELGDSLCEELEKHINECQPCVAFLANLEKSIEQCRTASNEKPDPDAAAKLRRDLLAEYQNVMASVGRKSKDVSRRA
jgi:RNA polymerase sigma-70 factor (ECF subfamily)